MRCTGIDSGELGHFLMAFSFYVGKMDKTIIGAIQEFIKGKRDEAK